MAARTLNLKVALLRVNVSSAFGSGTKVAVNVESVALSMLQACSISWLPSSSLRRPSYFEI